MVIRLPPLLDNDASFLHAHEFFAVQTLVSEPAIEAFDIAVLPRATRFDVGSPDIDLFEELSDTTADKLRAVVAADEFRDAANCEQIRQQFDELIACEFATDFQCKALACELIDHHKHLQRSSVRCPIENEIH